MTLSMISLAQGSEDECISKYDKGLLSQGLGRVRFLSPQDKDKETCKGKVGETFCLQNKKKEFLVNCKVEKKKDEKNEIRKAEKIQKIIKKHKSEKAKNR